MIELKVKQKVMKNYITWGCILFFCLSSFLSLSQQKNTYYVIRVNGDILNNTTGKHLQVKDKFSAEDEVSFGSKKDFVVVISSIQGHLILKPNKSHNVKGELRYYVEENLIPMQKHTSTRGKYTEFYNENDIKHFFENRPFLVLENNRFWLSKDIYNLGDSSYVFVMYDIGEKKVEYKLQYDLISQELLLNRSSMLLWKGKKVDNSKISNCKLYYYDGLWNTAFEIVPLNFVFRPDEMIVKEVELIKQFSNSNPDEKVMLADIYSYIRYVYGNFDEEALNKLLDF